MKIDWVRKLTSRKLWLSIASFVSMMYVALGGAESEAAQVSALIMAAATVIGYVLAEGLADSSNSTPQIEVTEGIEIVAEEKEG